MHSFIFSLYNDTWHSFWLYTVELQNQLMTNCKAVKQRGLTWLLYLSGGGKKTNQAMNHLRNEAGISDTRSRSARLPGSDVVMFTLLWSKSRCTFCYLFLFDMLIVAQALENSPPGIELEGLSIRACSQIHHGKSNPHSPYFFKIHFNNIIPPFNNILLPSGSFLSNFPIGWNLSVFLISSLCRAIQRSSPPSWFISLNISWRIKLSSFPLCCFLQFLIICLFR